MLRPEPVTLSGKHVVLEPLLREHSPELFAISRHAQLWILSLVPMDSQQDIDAYVAAALEGQAAGTALPFVQRCARSGALVGSTRFGNIDVFNRKVEVGWTWLTPERQRSGINTEAKYLLLRHAFETLGCYRVEFKGDARNEKSRKALQRIGAVFEGILRQHMRTADGGQRDSFYFSVIAAEWPQTKAHIEALMASYPSAD
ncbi:GNAT family N-acetyltransferase [bacterium]|nr:GNAT family N-acetyltransferase [bacterium]